MLENNEMKNTTINKALNCSLQDENGLNDFQKLPDSEGIAIPRVGINRFRIPLRLPSQDQQWQQRDCLVSMYVNLAKNKTGINMSRLCALLQSSAQEHVMDYSQMAKLLKDYRTELRDSPEEKPIEQSYLKIDFNYPLKQTSLKSENWGWQYYQCSLTAKQNESKGTEFYLTVNYEYSSTCPCSLSMARQYEQDYAQGLTQEGSGVAVAHGQRSNCQVKVKLGPAAVEQNFFIPELVQLLRKALPTETQSLVKRVDEQAFAILNGENPMFVEHASKRLNKVFNEVSLLEDWIASFEHYESLHSHNAVAVIFKGVPNGMQNDQVF